MDSNNPVVRLCASGMECEGDGRFDDALKLYTTAWNQSTDDFERAIAAHYLARHQQDPATTLLWNQRALEHADAVQDNRAHEFYPSLYLNLGKSHEDLGNRSEARRFYEMAADVLGSLPDGRYANVVRGAVENALARVQ